MHLSESAAAIGGTMRPAIGPIRMMNVFGTVAISKRDHIGLMSNEIGVQIRLDAS